MFIDKKKIFQITYILCLVLSIIACNSSKANQAPTILVKPIKLNQQDFFEKYISVGQCKAENSRTFYAKVNGVVDYISVKEGEFVKKDTIIIQIDADVAEASKNKAESAFKSAQAIFNRDLSLFDKKIISKEAFDKSKALIENARSDWISTLDKYDNMIIKAPFNGNIGVIHTQVGNDIKIGDYLFTIINNSEKIVLVELPENINGKINKNSEVFLLNKNDKIKGEIIAISEYLSDNGTITAKIIFPSDTKIIHGSFVEVEIIFDHHIALSINEKAVLKNNKGNFVYKITSDNKIQQIYVSTGSRNDNMIEISAKELNEGDLVVLEGLTKVTNGATVDIIKDETTNTKEQK
ncbi:MAG: efflux RND transporter periplasmic adaptor subunit [Rickettsiales bacterium]|nr:MAG: efflux RND transporter periplasmic adaptor subunit [Rickettsiales bacterium]